MKSLRVLRYKHTSPFHASIPISPIALAIPIHHQRPMFSTKQTTPPSIPHEVRTATEPRQNRLYNVQLSHIEQINPSVKLLQLTIPPSESKKEEVEVEEDDTPADSENQQPFTFLPGQWLDVHVPSVSKAGGFSITSTPADARVLPAPEHSSEQLGIEEIESAGRPPYVELAVQDAPTNPAAAWLWKEPREILGRELSIRVGGSFVWPPSSLPSGMEVEGIRSVVLIAGGMGINPIISILSHLNNNDPSLPRPPLLNVNILYSARLPSGSDPDLDQVLFLSRLRQIIRAQAHSRRLRISLEFFLTNLPDDSPLVEEPTDLTIHSRRIMRQDLQATVMGEDADVHPKDTVCYLCGPPKMTDEFVEVLRALLGEKERVIFEKWW